MMIAIELVSKTFRQAKKNVVALQNVSLSIGKGEIFGLIGVNGSGKTTLAKIIATLLVPDAGSVFVHGISVLHKPEQVKKYIGLSLGEGRSFYFRLTAAQNLEFFGTMLELPSKDLKNRINELLHVFHLEDSRHKAYMKFSFGMKRKLDLARAMLAKPEIYLLDEPTNGIDPLSQEMIRKMIHQLKQEGKTIFLITHNLHEANLLCDRVGIVDQGQLLWQGSIQDFVSEKETHILSITTDREMTSEEKNLMMQLPFVKKITSARQKTGSTDVSWQLYFQKESYSLSIILQSLGQFSLHIVDLHVQTPTIEDIFHQFVKEEVPKTIA